MPFEKYRFTTSPPTTFAEFILDPAKCTGCGRCIATCPIQILEIKNKKAHPNRRYKDHRCITCQSCITVCPKDAITIEGNYRVHQGLFKNDDIFLKDKTMPQPISKYKKHKFKDYEDKLTETERVIYKRRSIRLYKKKPVSREMIMRVIEAGRFAPSAGNSQPWKFIVIDKRELIDELDKKCKTGLKAVSYVTIPHEERHKKTPGSNNAKLSLWQKLIVPPLVRLKPDELDPRVIGGGANAPASDPDYDTFLGAPVLIIFGADKRGVGNTNLHIGMCGQNMTLAAHSLGLGACYIGLINIIKYFPGYPQKLGITPPFDIITAMTLGYPKGDIDRVVAREPARVEWIDKL